jgi:hypothetical protein
MNGARNSVLGPFLEALRARGFSVGLDRRLRLLQAIEAWEGQFPPQRLCTLLCPIFATTAEEQGLFYELFAQHFPHISVSEQMAHGDASLVVDSGMIEKALDGSETVAGVPTIESAPIKGIRRRSIRVATFSVLAFALFGLGAWYLHRRSPQIVPLASGKQGDLKKPEAPPILRRVDLIETLPASPIELDSKLNPVSTAPVARAARWLRAWWKSLFLLLPLLLWLCIESWIWFHRRAILSRGGDPPSKALPFGRLVWPVQPVARAGFAATLRRLRQPETGPSRPHLGKTIAATARAAGFSEFQYEPVLRRPEYLVLIDRASARDHQATFFEELAATLDRAGLRVATYGFSGDPRVCHNAKMAELLTWQILFPKPPTTV